LLLELRKVSLTVVELVVLWREQLRYYTAIAKKKRRNIDIAIPFLTNEHFNYLLKMKTDTNDFGKLAISKYFNFRE
jgi:hypothetical protein